MSVPRTEDVLAALVGFDTTSRNPNLPLIEWIEAFLDVHRVPHFRAPSEDGTKANLFATIGPAGVPGIVLSGHTDVVPVDGQDWSSDPFALTTRDGRLHGRGAADMKGFIACCLGRVPAMVAAGLARPVHLALSYDEEIGCVGVIGLLEELAGRAVPIEAVIVGEPTGMGVVTAHKAKRSLRTTFTGRAAHSSLPHEGVNAVSHAARLVARIDAIGERLARGPGDPLYDAPHSTAHVGVMAGGTALNIVPRHAEVLHEFRVLPGEDADALVAELAAFVEDEIAPAMRATHPECGAEMEVLMGYPGLDTPPDAPVVTLAKRLAGRNDHAKVAFGTEGGRFAEILGAPTVVIGPGSIEQAHKPDEFIEIDQLRACETFLDRLIDHCRSAP